MAGDEEQHLSPEPQTTETTDVESGTAGYRNRKVLASQKRPATEVTTSSHDEANPGGTEGCDDADDDDDYEEDESGIVEIPLPGLEICAREREGDATAETPLATCRMGTKRCVPAFCAVCLSSYKPGNTIVWSSNRECSHVFHEECIQQWLFKLPQRDGPICPCCRRDFLVDPYDLLLVGVKADDADDEGGRERHEQHPDSHCWARSTVGGHVVRLPIGLLAGGGAGGSSLRLLPQSGGSCGRRTHGDSRRLARCVTHDRIWRSRRSESAERC